MSMINDEMINDGEILMPVRPIASTSLSAVDISMNDNREMILTGFHIHILLFGIVNKIMFYLDGIVVELKDLMLYSCCIMVVLVLVLRRRNMMKLMRKLKLGRIGMENYKH